VNCVLSNPFYREKVIKSPLIKKRIAAITDRQILMDQFLGVFQKSFRNSSITIMYDKPITKCSILISAADMIEVEWIHQLRDLLMLSDQIDINVDNDTDNVDDSENDLCDIIIQKYSQYFPCSIILNIIEKEYKVVIIVPSLQAKNYILNKLTEYCDLCIKRNTVYGDKDKEKIKNCIVNERIRYEVGDIEEQCNFELELQFENKRVTRDHCCSAPSLSCIFRPKNRPKKRIERKYTITMISGDSIENTAFIERDEEIVDRKFCSTKSGIVQCVDDGEIYVITTGHYMNENCFPSNPNYTLIGRMWPSALELKDADDIVNKKGYDSLLDDGSKPPCVSDVAILKPNIDIRTIGTCTRSDIVKYHTNIRGLEVPIIPGKGTTFSIQELKATLNYSGCRTEGIMEVVGSGYFCQNFNGKFIYERFYVAIHISSHLVSGVSKADGSKGTLPGDSGACVTTMVDGKIHSFVIGTITAGDNKFRLLSPAHFVLEQIKTLTNKKVDFVRCEEEKSAFYDNSVTAQTTVSHPVDFHDGNNGAAATDTSDNDESEVDNEYSQAINAYDDEEDSKVDDECSPVVKVYLEHVGKCYNNNNNDTIDGNENNT